MIRVSDRDNGPIVGAKVTGRFLRTSSSRDDFEFSMSELAAGEYRVDLTMPLHGHWQLVLQVRRGEDLHEVRADTSVTRARDSG
jgi:nitrogen fixation protein FixH